MNFTRSMALGLAAFLALNPSGVRAAPGATAPDALVKEVSAEVIAVLKQDQAAGRPTDIAQLVEQKILPLFDFERMTSMAVARNWRSATPAQQSALVGEFRTLLVRTYSVSLSSYRDEVIDYKPLRGGAGEGEVLVRSSVKRSGAEPLTIDYQMAERESFAAVVRDAGIDGLIKTLSEKNRPYAAPSSAAGNSLAPSNGRKLARSQVHVRGYHVMAAEPA